MQQKQQHTPPRPAHTPPRPTPGGTSPMSVLLFSLKPRAPNPDRGLDSDEVVAHGLRDGRVHYPPNNWMQDCIFFLANNHLLLMCFYAHRLHPFGRFRQGLVLLSSLSFAFFLSAAFSLLPYAGLRGFLSNTLGTVLQLMWDLPALMLGRCACVHVGPRLLRKCCGCFSTGCLIVHTCLGIFWAVIGLGLIQLVPDEETSAVYEHFVRTKLMAFGWAIPVMIFAFGLMHSWEKQGTRHKVAAHLSAEGRDSPLVGRAAARVVAGTPML